MPAPKRRTPLQAAAEGIVIAAGIVLTLLLLMRGKVLVAVLLIALCAGIVVRIRRNRAR